MLRHPLQRARPPLLRALAPDALYAAAVASRRPPLLPRLSQLAPLPRAFTTSRVRDAQLTVQVPQMAESISEGTLSQLFKKIGDRVDADEELATIETDKIDVSVNAPEAGVVAELLVQEGDVVTVGQDIVRIETGAARQDAQNSVGQETASTQPQPAEASKQSPQSRPPEPLTHSPAANSAEQPNNSSQPEQRHTQVSTPLAASLGRPLRNERVQKLSRMRKTIATRLKQSQNTCASLTTVQRVDMSALMAWRAKYKEEVAETQGVRLGYMGAFAKATSLAAQQVPQVNASIDTEREVITYRDYVDISIAVSTPKGLVTPVIRNCEEMDLIEIEREIAAMAKKAGQLRLPPASFSLLI
ncbi:Uncharacterized protein TPAR_08799 [Tolypocladium paradoxum]|uniref:Dihydrolipoamide acetyltransferase component of pyruvate dehydrogenase complex n=1 Tax=Tolypocladium paradoxum TaxID=94208 RepID=A0A2S4KLA5_9HYPO|nr:Uncharacterized protein TPAR_08799 [Tolypocladium paradoxum]